MTVGAPLYLRVLGDCWSELAEPLRRLHAAPPAVRARGRFRVERGVHPAARLLARVLRLPLPGAADTRLVVTVRGDGERWERTFDRRRFVTWQYRSDDELVERFGVLQLRFLLRVSDGSLRYVPRQAALRWWPVCLPIPGRWAPRVEAREDPAGPGRIHVEVRVMLPGIGLLVSYAGIIEVEESGR